MGPGDHQKGMARYRTWRWGGQGGTAQLSKPGVCGLQVGRAHVGLENMLTSGEAREGSWKALEMSGGNTFSRIERKGERKKKPPNHYQYKNCHGSGNLQNYMEIIRIAYSLSFLLILVQAEHEKASGPIKL